jgi:hypothetical protein
VAVGSNEKEVYGVRLKAHNVTAHVCVPHIACSNLLADLVQEIGLAIYSFFELRQRRRLEQRIRALDTLQDS